VLHAYPYRETSMLLEVYTRAFGRLSMVARGARRPRSALRGVLPFLPAAAAFVVRPGRGAHARTCRVARGQPLLHGEALAVRLLSE